MHGANRQTTKSVPMMFLSGERAQLSACDVCRRRHELIITGTRCQIAWCVSCARQLQMVTLADSKSVMSFSKRRILRWLSLGRQFFFETAEGLIFVNLNRDA